MVFYMKRVLVRKLRSETGASLMFALFLFIVCAVVGMIVITAGTVASGRLADEAEMNRRYYGVVSVMDVLRDEFDNKEVVIVRTYDRINGTYTLGYADGSKSSDGSDVIVPYENDLKFFKNDFLTDNSIALLNCESIDVNLWNADFYSDVDKTMEYKLDLTNGADVVYTVPVNVRLYGGNIELVVSDNNYVLKMVLTPDINEIEITEDDITTKTATITWLVRNVEKVSG